MQSGFEGFVRSKPPHPSLLYLTGIIASNLLTWYFKEFFATDTLQGSYSHTYPQQIRSFPFRRITFITPAIQRTALVDGAKALYDQGIAAQATGGNWRAWRDHWHALWDWADARLPRQADSSLDIPREQSDAVHDLLAFLAEHMIELHKQKQAGAAAFTDWLEQETGSAIDEWSGKTMVQSFWEEPWENIERTLQKNRGKFIQAQGLRGKAGDAAMAPLVRTTKGRWQEATNALGPTLAAITATDRLIDLLVYRLYGLTDEEIDLVEGA